MLLHVYYVVKFTLMLLGIGTLREKLIHLKNDDIWVHRIGYFKNDLNNFIHVAETDPDFTLALEWAQKYEIIFFIKNKLLNTKYKYKISNSLLFKRIGLFT